MPESKSLKVNSILNVLKSVSSIIFPLITFPYVSRVLGPINVGKVNFGNAFVGYFALIATLGVTTYAIRECSAVREDKHKLETVASEIFSINMVTTLVAYALLFLSLLLFRKLDVYRNLILIQSTAILFTTWGADWINSAMEDFKYITIRTMLFQVLSLIAMFIFVHNESDYFQYATISVVASSGANLSNVLYRRKYCTIRLTRTMHWKVHFRPILMLFVMIMAQTVFNNADITMLGLMQGDYAVGIYTTAQKIKNIISQIVSSLCWVVMPRISLYFAQNDWERINAMLKKVLSVMVAIGFPCIAGCSVLARDIVTIVGGERYTAAALPLIILMLSFAVDIFGGAFLGNMVCLPAKQEGTFMKACCGAAVFNVVTNYLLIPWGGVSAAALTSGGAAVIIAIWLLVKKDKRIKLDYIFEVIRAPLIGSLLIVVACWGIGQFIGNMLARTVICICVSTVLYFGAMVVMKNRVVMDVLGTVFSRGK